MKINYRFKLCWILWLAIFLIVSENSLYGISTSYKVKDCVVNALENRTEDENLLQINFSFPETVKAGQIFTFEFVIAKEGEHSIGGRFQFSWPVGFLPQASDNPKVKCRIDKRIMFVEWDAQTFAKDVKISYPVQVNNVTSGVYPILSTLTILGGIKIEKNTKIRVEADNPGNPGFSFAAMAENYNIHLEYPAEAEFGELYNLNIHLHKGNSTGPALLKVSVPPLSDVTVLDHDDFEYNQYSGKMIVRWNKLPENPAILLNCQVITNISTKAAYPISAEFFIDQNLKATYLNSIYLSDKVMPVKERITVKTKTENDVRKADSVKLYAEMDELLNQWKNATKIVTIETGKTSNIPANEKSNSIQSTQMVSDKETDAKKLKTQESLTFPPDIISENVQKQQVQADIQTEGVKVYRVQIAASKTPVPGTKQFIQSLGFYETVTEDFDGTWYRYFVGEFNQISEAKDFNKKLVEKGVIDSFVVTLINGKKVTSN